MTNKEKSDKGLIWLIGILCIVLTLIIFGLIVCVDIIKEKDRQLEFEPVKEGLCVYVEYPNAYTGDFPIPTYLLVYDYETEKVIEVDIFADTVHTRINVGDTILYVVDYNYCDADFLNVIKE